MTAHSIGLLVAMSMSATNDMQYKRVIELSLSAQQVCVDVIEPRNMLPSPVVLWPSAQLYYCH